ncbi:triacylglycerol lipase OBL1 [Tanacetum coccineum]
MDMVCDKSFSTGKYMLLDHEKVGVVDLVHMLHSIDIKKRNFVDCPNDMIEKSFKRRWLLSMSVLAQKILKSIAKPLAATGSAIEHWLNLVSCNGNLGGLIWNSIRGEMIQPDKTSATFISFTGNLDTRVELDKTIVECGDRDRYISLLSVMAAKASYENHAYLQHTVNDIWKMELMGSYDFWNDYQQKATTQAFMLRDKKDDYDLIVVTFRGTETFDADAWSSDVDLSWYELRDMGKVHGGFMKALGLKKSQGFEKDLIMNQEEPLAYYVIRDMLKQALKENNKTKFIVTGHSLGGALAVLFTAVLMKDNEVELLGMLEGVYTYGQPRVGDETFGQFMEKNMEIHQVKYYRTVYSNDLVPRLPYDDSTMMFKHFGTCLYFDSFYNGKKRLDDKKLQIQECTVQKVKASDGTMFLNMDQLEKQLDNEEFHEIRSMASFKVLETQFQMFIKSQIYLDDEYVKSIDERALHKREYDTTMNERQMQTKEVKVDTCKALDDNIRPIYDEELMAEVQTTAEINVFAIRQQHTEQPEFNNEGEVDHNAKQCHDTCPLPAKLTNNQITELSYQSLESKNICLKKTVA